MIGEFIMSRRIFLILLICLSAVLLYKGMKQSKQELGEEVTPQYLYKVLSVEEWKESQNDKSVKLGAIDKDFIHLSTEDQLSRIVEKYWGNVKEYVVVKIDTKKLPGKLVYEANPGGTNKYYHLYNATIPLSAVVDAKTIKK